MTVTKLVKLALWAIVALWVPAVQCRRILHTTSEHTTVRSQQPFSQQVQVPQLARDDSVVLPYCTPGQLLAPCGAWVLRTPEERLAALSYDWNCPVMKTRYNCQGNETEKVKYKWVPGAVLQNDCWPRKHISKDCPFDRNVTVLMWGNSHLRQLFESWTCRHYKHFKKFQVGRWFPDDAENVDTRLIDFKEGSCGFYNKRDSTIYFDDPPEVEEELDKCQDNVAHFQCKNGARVYYAFQKFSPFPESYAREEDTKNLPHPNDVDVLVLADTHYTDGFGFTNATVELSKYNYKKMVVMSTRLDTAEEAPFRVDWLGYMGPKTETPTMATQCPSHRDAHVAFAMNAGFGYPLHHPETAFLLDQAAYVRQMQQARVVNKIRPDGDNHLCLPGAPDVIADLLAQAVDSAFSH